MKIPGPARYIFVFMAKSRKNKEEKKVTSEKPTKIKGSFLDVFKVVKKNKEEKSKKKDA